jgi:hypothetical protein
MNCEWVKDNVTLYVYDELADDARYEMEQHLGRCAGCAAELETARRFKQAMFAYPQMEPTPNLLASCRMGLQEALESARQHRAWRWSFDPTAWLRQVRFSPALASVILIFGFAAGILTTWQVAGPRAARTGGATAVSASPAQATEASISGIRGISQAPGSNKIEIKYDKVSSESVEGSLDDPRIQQLLLYAARNNNNSGVRMDSVDLLTQNSKDDHAREVLIYALRYDTNPGVRLKALEGLKNYVKDDVRVRDAMLEALVNDSNPGVRAEAIQMIQPVKADGSVRDVLQHLARQDRDQYIRSQARQVLSSMPTID